MLIITYSKKYRYIFHSQNFNPTIYRLANISQILAIETKIIQNKPTSLSN